ncbi:AAA family ATPase [Undibacterium crateris]|uniref:AAA family ATPase n=1 Tax=Undibacterium crateris TaxID=2528175 RepID=UPI00138A50E2|nr:ATP-binding protein [Undibacterium crateris]NDI84386.1 AAA family ATPase [Undibacterium crateris]
MQEKLTISNFLVIKNAAIEVRRINVIIGPQANGKSLIAKLLHYFKSIGGEILEGIRKDKGKRELDKSLIEFFEKRFPRYTWDGSSFTINYEVDATFIRIIGKKNSSGKTSISIRYSDDITKIYNSKRKLFIKKLDEAHTTVRPTQQFNQPESEIFYENVIAPLRRGELSYIFGSPIFIPATRSFFANLQKNIFTFLASNLDIDPYLKEFGSLYETSKRWYKEGLLFNRIKHKNLLEETYRAVEAIIVGDYESQDEQDWIISRGRKTNLANASSGQQEALPMLLTLCVWPILREHEDGSMCFIEEPEAHLFPTSQGHIVSIISQFYSKLGTKFFITTHSPYIISALNNFILAADKVAEAAMTEGDFIKINGGGRPIKFSDISAYSMANGEALPICDAEYRMVGATMLDSISEHFESVMNKMLSSEA